MERRTKTSNGRKAKNNATDRKQRFWEFFILISFQYVEFDFKKIFKLCDHAIAQNFYYMIKKGVLKGSFKILQLCNLATFKTLSKLRHVTEITLKRNIEACIFS